jgi:hypothetical protein
VGAVIGNGLGVRYGYVDLVLANLERAIGHVLEDPRSGRTKTFVAAVLRYRSRQ